MQRQEIDELNARIAAAVESPELTDMEKNIVLVLHSHRGAMNAIRSGEIARLVGLEPGEGSRRTVAQTVATLVLLHKLPIGGLRVAPYGYFLIESKRDLDLAIQARWNEVYAHMRYLRALTSRDEVAKLFGQGLLDLDGEQAGAWEPTGETADA